MNIANGIAAFYVFISILAVPAAAMLGVGMHTWYHAPKGNHRNERLGRMLTMFGLILLAIVGIIMFFGRQTGVTINE